MGDTIEVILNYLRKNHFTKAEAALEEEVNSRQNVESGLSPVRDGLDDKLVQHLSSFQQTALPLDFDPLTISIQRALNTSGHQIDEVPQKQVLENPAMNNRGIIACPTRCQSETLQEKCLFGTSQDQYLKLQNFAAGTKEAPVHWVNKDTLLKDSVNTNAMQDLIQPEENKGVTEEDKNVQSCMEHLLHKEDEKLGMQLFLERELTEARNDAEQCQSYETKVEEKEVMHSKRLQNQIKGACLAATTAGNRKKESSHVGTSDEDYAQSGLSSNVALRATWKDSSELGFSNLLLKPAVYDEETPVSGQTAHKNDVTDVTLVDLFQHEKVPIQKAFPVHEMNKCFQEEIGNGENEESVHANNSLEPSTEVLPRLPPVKLHSLDKHLDSSREGSGAGNSTRSFESAFRSLGSTPEGPFGLSSFFELPLGHDFSSSGTKQISARPSVSQGIVEDCLPGFAMPGDELSESREYVDDYWDSDGYEDEDDPGYLRQPIEDEAWFLAHEIDYPSEDERARNGAGKSQNSYNELRKFEEDEHSFVEEESYFSGEEYYKSKHDRLTDHNRRDQVRYDDFDDRLEKSDTSVLKGPETSGYNGDLMNSEQINFLDPDLSWNGFVSQNKHDNDHGGRVYSDSEIPEATCSLVVNADSDNAERSGVIVKYNVPQLGSGSRDYFVPGSSERDVGIFISDQELALCGSATTRFCQSHSPQERLGRVESRHVEVKNAPVRHLDDDEDDDHDRILQFFNESWGHKKHNVGREVPNMAAFKHTIVENENRIGRIDGQQDSMVKDEQDNGGFGFGGFSFPSHSSAGDVIGSKSASRKSLLSTRDSTGQSEEGDKHFNSMNGPDDTLDAWKRKSNESSPIFSSRDEHLLALNLSNQSAASVHSTDDYVSIEAREGTEGHETGQTESIDLAVADDEDTTTINEQIRKSGVEEDEFEVFDLRIVHRKNRTGFEEEKDFPVVISSLIAGRYHVTEYLGSAAFSKAIQAHDLYTGIDVCMKVIKNNKDFFDQSLDEIKLLKFVNKHDPADKYHVLRLYDYFYHREHLFIVCELLRANLYEFQKFNKESGGEVYFTMPRLQLIARQCLEALEFLHGLGLIHCDLKPENILVKSYSRCEIKVIDLGSSCFQTDHLCSYVQSRSYRAPEVILGLPYDQKIDMWSLGCILAELCSGNVLFQNDSLATLLARVIGILGPIDPEMLAKGRDTYRFFTKNHMLYERNQETGQLEYLLPKKTSLSYRLPMGDQGFIEFVRYLLQINVANRPTAREALQHPWLLYPYESVSS